MFKLFRKSSEETPSDPSDLEPWRFLVEGVKDSNGDLRQYCLNFLGLTEEDLEKPKPSSTDNTAEALKKVLPHVNKAFIDHGKLITEDTFHKTSESKLVRSIREIAQNDLSMESRATLRELLVRVAALLYKRFN